MPAQLLVSEPASTIDFEGTFHVPTHNDVHVFNPTGSRIAYKMRTTAPNRFYVSPHSGIVGPNQEVVIHITFQACAKHPTFKFSPRFKLMSFLIPAGTNNSGVPDMWGSLSRDRLMETVYDTKYSLVPPQKSLPANKPKNEEGKMKTAADDDMIPDQPNNSPNNEPQDGRPERDEAGPPIVEIGEGVGNAIVRVPSIERGNNNPNPPPENNGEDLDTDVGQLLDVDMQLFVVVLSGFAFFFLALFYYIFRH